jgi:hypothetical protein
VANAVQQPISSGSCTCFQALSALGVPRLIKIAARHQGVRKKGYPDKPSEQWQQHDGSSSKSLKEEAGKAMPLVRKVRDYNPGPTLVSQKNRYAFWTRRPSQPIIGPLVRGKTHHICRANLDMSKVLKKALARFLSFLGVQRVFWENLIILHAGFNAALFA